MLTQRAGEIWDTGGGRGVYKEKSQSDRGRGVTDIKTELMIGFILGRLFPQKTLLSPTLAAEFGRMPSKTR